MKMLRIKPQCEKMYEARARQKKKQLIIHAKDVPCMDCGVRYPHYVMDFDHRDRDDKEYNLAAIHKSASVEKLMKEIAKCDVVCANCHRIRTHKTKACYPTPVQVGTTNAPPPESLR